MSNKTSFKTPNSSIAACPAWVKRQWPAAVARAANSKHVSIEQPVETVQPASPRPTYTERTLPPTIVEPVQPASPLTANELTVAENLN